MLRQHISLSVKPRSFTTIKKTSIGLESTKGINRSQIKNFNSWANNRSYEITNKQHQKTLVFNSVIPQNLTRGFKTTSVTRAAKADVAVGGVIQFNLADIGEGIAECEILKWHVKEGDKIRQFDLLCEVQSDKATVEITSRYDGVIKKLHYKKGDMAKVGSPLVDIDTGSGSSASAKPTTPEKQPTKQEQPQAPSTPSQAPASSHLAEHNEKVLATPAVRHLARKHNLDLRQIQPSGRDGRVLKEDVIKFVESGGQPQPVAAKAAPSTPAAPPSVTIPPPLAEDRVITLSGYSRIMAKTMAASVSVPRFGYCDEIVMDALLKFRKDLKSIGDKQGVKITYMPIIIKAISLALKKYPYLNSHYNDAAGTLTLKASHNIGVAMDTPNGLVVPNIKNVQDKSLIEVAREMNRLHELALKAALPRDDLTGGTFSISNIGSIGGTYASPVIVVPEVAIGAIGRMQKVPRFDEKNNVIPVHVMNVSWSADHRVIDGATMANFSNLWKNYLENP
eukprot:CAMPEP_0168564316 /NCGR_PEP_ID=MMETSP0413-20121227/13177_1 /TAXON_ID=136452 /ORGANISM="Filamoeba nolandi, Strain NC-AS-23-1" /LENGTH=506 /DNA_ID=CAMNT_0008595973 /DNA_START=43 /DNA_END=1560 /DNA_ORIENTATION=-